MARGKRVGDTGAWDRGMSRVDRSFGSRLTQLHGLRVRKDRKGARCTIAIATGPSSDPFAEQYRVVITNVARATARRAPTPVMAPLRNLRRIRRRVQFCRAEPRSRFCWEAGPQTSLSGSSAYEVRARVRTSDADSGPTIVMLQDFCVSLSLVSHDCRADLA
jgi:hypothetical protein